MQRMSQLIKSSVLAANTLAAEQTLLDTVYTQCVRWKRKPIWLPTAKSKVFRVPVKPVLQPGEAPELLRLYNNYRTMVKSIKIHLMEIAAKEASFIDEATQERNEEEDFKRCLEINQIWNAQRAEEREQRLKVEREQKLESITKKLEEKEKRDARLQQEADEKIRIMKEESVTFITADNIDAAIEEVIMNVTNHNAALDVSGKFLGEDEISKAAVPFYNYETLRYEPKRRSKLNEEKYKPKSGTQASS